MQILFSVLTISAIFTKSKHIYTAVKEKNNGRLKGELLLLFFIVILGIGLIAWS